ncbi:unnamed protein product [Caenorhabditis sp. 36 PRJEB53466]|nr:unnamed protein product [Caenorhabditis sp. 36 PRJEB53466]
MASVKWPMLNLHLWSSLLDVSISLLTTPYVLFPVAVGVPYGLMESVGIKTQYQVHWVVTVVGLVTTATLTVFENRFHILTAGKTVWSRHRIAVLSILYSFMATFLLPFTLSIPDQNVAVKIALNKLPCLPPEVYKLKMFVYSLNILPLLCIVIALFLLHVFVIFSFAGLCIKTLLRKSTRLSKKTLTLQRKFLYALITQTSVPVLLLFCPIGYIATSAARGYHNQGLNNFMFIVFSFHGVVTTLTMLLSHPRYRSATLSIFGCSPYCKFQSILSVPLLLLALLCLEGSVEAGDGSEVIVKEFIATFHKVVKSRDKDSIGALFDDDYFLHGCKINRTKDEQVQFLSSLFSDFSVDLDFKICHFMRDSKDIKVYTKINKEGPKAEYMLVLHFSADKYRLKSATEWCGNSIRSFVDVVPPHNKYVFEIISAYVRTLVQAVDERNSAMISSFLSRNFVLQLCADKYTKRQIIAFLVSLPKFTRYSVDLISAEFVDDTHRSIVFTVEIYDYGQELTAEFTTKIENNNIIIVSARSLDCMY